MPPLHHSLGLGSNVQGFRMSVSLSVEEGPSAQTPVSPCLSHLLVPQSPSKLSSAPKPSALSSSLLSQSYSSASLLVSTNPLLLPFSLSLTSWSDSLHALLFQRRQSLKKTRPLLLNVPPSWSNLSTLLWLILRLSRNIPSLLSQQTYSTSLRLCSTSFSRSRLD